MSYGFDTGYPSLNRYYEALYTILEKYYRSIVGLDSDLLVSGLRDTVPSVNQSYAAVRNLYTDKYFDDFYRNYDWDSYLKAQFSYGDSAIDYRSILSEYGFGSSGIATGVKGRSKGKGKRRSGRSRSTGNGIGFNGSSLLVADPGSSSPGGIFDGDRLVQPRNAQAARSSFRGASFAALQEPMIEGCSGLLHSASSAMSALVEDSVLSAPVSSDLI